MMRKNIIRLLAAIGIMLSFVSCSKKEGELELYDLGKATFKEPFVGLLKGRPGILVKSLKYPPYSWAAPDTAFVEKTFKISFNEDCVRSGSEAIVQIRDTHYVSSENIRVFHNGEYVSNGEFRVVADSLKKTMTLRYVLSPSLGKATIDGYILIRGKELDSVNGKMLRQDNNAIGKWKCEQKIGWPILLWVLWLLTALIILCIVAGIIAGIIYLCYWIGKGIVSLNTDGIFYLPFLRNFNPDGGRIKIINAELAGKRHPDTGVPYSRRKLILTDSGIQWGVFPKFQSRFDAKLPRKSYRVSDSDQFLECNRQLKKKCEASKKFKSQFTETQLEQIYNPNFRRAPEGFVWNHDVKRGKMQLVDFETHLRTRHTGGKAIWGGGAECR